jgi:hypothetical protein
MFNKIHALMPAPAASREAMVSDNARAANGSRSDL